MEASQEKNPWSVQGEACLMWWKGQTDARLTMTSIYGEVDIPVDIYFRTEEEMPELESYALSHCSGHVLEVGAGTGSHALLLQEAGLTVTALDIDPTLVQIMTERGITDARQADIFDYQDDPYDTILMLMNGIGIAGTLSRLPDLLTQCRKLLTQNGRLIFDTSDLHGVLSDGPIAPTAGGYIGEVWYTLSYRNRQSTAFPWLFLDEETLIAQFASAGWKAFVAYTEDDGHYLVIAQPL